MYHMQQDLLDGYPFQIDMLLFEGAMNQSVVTLGGIR
jgi:hypothetical protein